MATILITGGSGLIGTALQEALITEGHKVRVLGRSRGDGVRRFQWDPDREVVDEAALRGVDHIVHLAGAGIAEKRWTAARVRVLTDSRTRTALLLLRLCREQGIAPRSFVSAAGINWYGAITSDRVHTESDPPAADTIGRISRAWEEAVDEWASVCRVVKLRTPVVLSAQGGALEKLAAPVRLGLGAPLGTGRQWMPWVHLGDLVRAYQQALSDDRMQGAYNVCAAEHVTNARMMRSVARVLGKPFFLPPVPGFVLRVVLGDMASILLHGSRASNQRLLATGFRFQYDTLEPALEHLLRR
jgi:uncharacterized protein (TIGR01777 family)